MYDIWRDHYWPAVNHKRDHVWAIIHGDDYQMGVFYRTATKESYSYHQVELRMEKTTQPKGSHFLQITL